MTKRRRVGKKRPNMGRKKLYPVRLTLPITNEMLAAIEKKRGAVPRVDWIRRALQRQIKPPRRKVVR